MKARALANGEVVELDEGAAEQLIGAGIYEPVAEQPKPKAPEPPAPKQPDPKKSTKVEPLTTEDMPVVPTKKAK